MQIKTISLFILAALFLGCEESTTTPAITDIESIKIENNVSTIYSTDPSQELYATVYHTDGSTGDASDSLTWQSSDTSIATLLANRVYGGTKNGGDVNITVSYEHFSDTLPLHVIKLVDFTISHAEINTTGEHPLEAIGLFEDNSSRVIYNNISWEANNSALITTNDDITSITISAGVTELNATLFAEDNETNITKSIIYTIE